MSTLLFDDPQIASALAPVIASAVSSGDMPPFYAEETEECPNPWGWTHDPRLDSDTIALITAWADAGGPIGDPEMAAPLVPPASIDLADVDQTLTPQGPWTTSVFGTTQDEFVCFTMDPGLDEVGWLEAFQVLPQDTAVVHHVLVGVDATGASASLADENGVYECFGSFGVDATFIGGWVPGSSPIQMPQYSGVRVDPDARIVMQMHYHLVDEPRQDATSLAVRWAESTPVRPAQFRLQGNAGSGSDGLQPGPNDEGEPEFFIPAGSTDHTEIMGFEFGPEVFTSNRVFLVANHMHYIGVDMRMWVESADSDEDVCLLHTPQWSFDWQQFYGYDVDSGLGPIISQGDVLWLECMYDNTLDNPGVVGVLTETGLTDPVDVGLGNGSLDEMCIGVIGQVADLVFTEPNETHTGSLDLVVDSEELGFSLPCVGPASITVDDKGTLSGRGHCGLDIGEILVSLSVMFQGEVTVDGDVLGTSTAIALGVEGDSNGTVLGSTSGTDFSVTVESIGTFAGAKVTFSGTIESD